MRQALHLIVGLPLFGMLMMTSALAAECPPTMPPNCKILYLNPDEEMSLVGPKMILETAEQGRPLDLSFAVKYWREKLAKAEQGIIPPPPPPSPQPPAQ